MPADIIATPKLSISSDPEDCKKHTPGKAHPFRYRGKHHRNLPHVVKFSGGMLIFILLENGFLKRERGDVVVFNNTSCEHPETYRFTAQCKKRVESARIPFFFVEYQTYEDARKGEWKRIASYHLVNERPFSDDNPEGFRWRGEVFEEMLSYKGYLPNKFSRVCTQSLKLETTRLFLRDWLAGKPGIPQQGHRLEKSKVNARRLHERHLRNGGSIPEAILLEKKRFVLQSPPNRPQQSYREFSSPAGPFYNETLQDKVFGRKARFGKGGIEYVAFIGLRGDEQLRVSRVTTRASNSRANAGCEGEHVYMPLAAMHISKEDVNAFWQQQNWDLNLPQNSVLSNCVYCFLKGAGSLEQVHTAMEEQKKNPAAGFGSTVGTPCDINWWLDREKLYGRDLKPGNRKRANPDAPSFIGFFGAANGFSYDALASRARNGGNLEQFTNTVLPCDCTE